MTHFKITDLDRRRLAVAEIENTAEQLSEIAADVRSYLYERVFGRSADQRMAEMPMDEETKALVSRTIQSAGAILKGDWDAEIMDQLQTLECAKSLIEDAESAERGLNSDGKPKKKAGSRFEDTPRYELLPQSVVSPEVAEEWRVIRKAREGDRQAKYALYKRHIGIIIKTIQANVSYDAKRVGLERKDLEQIAYFAIEKAIHKYDPNRGYRFVSYLGYWVRAVENRAVDKFDPNLTPQTFRAIKHEFGGKRAELQRKLGREPSDEETARALGWRDSKLQTFLKYRSRKLSSLETPIDEEGTLLHAVIPAPDSGHSSGYEKIQLSHYANKALASLDERSKNVVERRLGLNGYPGESTLDEIGRLWGLSREAIRLIFMKAIKQMRLELESKGIRSSDDLLSE